MEEYYAKQQSLRTKINNSFHNFKSKGKDNITEGNAQARLTGLEKNYSIIQSTHEKIVHLKELDRKHVYFTSNLVDMVEDSFYDRKGEFLDFLKSLREKMLQKGLRPPLLRFLQSTNVSYQSLHCKC